MGKSFLTKEGKRKYEQERTELLQACRQQGQSMSGLKFKKDSCNVELINQQDELSRLRSRLKEVEQILENSEIIEDRKFDRVEIGAKVILKFGDESNAETYRIGVKDPGIYTISTEAPLYRELIGKKPGEIVEYSNDNGDEYSVEIKDII